MPLGRSRDTRRSCKSVQLERGTCGSSNSPGIIFDDDDSIQAWKEYSVLLHNVVKPEDLDDPISIGDCASSSLPLFATLTPK